ncbi:MAG: glycosyl transferase [Bacteroidaceae bacterium]|nr:glycosyl transferase [Bacteroidaceae bacterium]
MIPKTIHYCWFGGNSLPKSARKCIASWRKFLPDYEIKEWNEGNFDVNICSYTSEAYRLKKYAFVSDYARFWILYNYGGIYFDTDVEVVAGIDDIVERGAFMGIERKSFDGVVRISTAEHLYDVAVGLGFAMPAGHWFGKQMLEYYGTHRLLNDIGNVAENVVQIVSRLLTNKGCAQELEDGIISVDDILIYPSEYFCPKDYKTNEMFMTKNTRTIHHYSASWFPWYSRLAMKVCHMLGITYKRRIMGRWDRLRWRLQKRRE